MMNLSPGPSERRAPWWVIAIIVIAALPAVSFPRLLADIGATGLQETVRLLLWGYPFYIVAAAWLAVISYRRRPYVTWILVALMVLTHFAIYILCNDPTLT
ncbi:MAG: hypothetical protein J1E63_09490 [Muribaculaceae bacterium]|nr:hypothetical protein [Muribaculaceae bacterium]